MTVEQAKIILASPSEYQAKLVVEAMQVMANSWAKS